MPRAHVFTLHNYTAEEEEALRNLTYDYLIVGHEICPNTGTPHLQGYIEWTYNVPFSRLKRINQRISWRPRLGTPKQAADYCKKDGDWWEEGQISSQGERTDLHEIFDSIKSGRCTVEQVRNDNPLIYHQYGRTMEKLEDDYLRTRERDFMTEGIWIWGPTGVGKSHTAFTRYKELGSVYVWKSDNGWWDAYKQQDTVIINEFRGQIPYNELLTMIDKWPDHVRRRNREPMPFLSKRVVITSALPPHEVYRNVEDRDSIKQLLRRLKVEHLNAKPKLADDEEECISA